MKELHLGGLAVTEVSSLREGETGGTAVVLLHGWGAPGDDLVALAEVLAPPRSRCFFPAGPLPEIGGGRAWWHLDESRPPHAGSGGPAPPEHPDVRAARDAIVAVVAEIKQRHAPERLILGGFSQGAMLSLEVALATPVSVDGIVALSGVLLAQSLAALATWPRERARPPVLVAHGRFDPLLPFRGGERIAEVLAAHGFPVVFQGFDGGHEIPRSVLTAVQKFLVAPGTRASA